MISSIFNEMHCDVEALVKELVFECREDFMYEWNPCPFTGLRSLSTM